jgi:hypothetical protein
MRRPRDPVGERAPAVLESSRQIWPRGPGRCSKAQARQDGVLDTSPCSGRSASEKRTRSVAETTAAARRCAARAKAARRFPRRRTRDAGAGLEDRVARALSKLGASTRRATSRSSPDRASTLAESVNELPKHTGVKPKRRARPSPVKKMVKGAVKSAARSARQRRAGERRGRRRHQDGETHGAYRAQSSRARWADAREPAPNKKPAHRGLFVASTERYSRFSRRLASRSSASRRRGSCP